MLPAGGGGPKAGPCVQKPLGAHNDNARIITYSIATSIYDERDRRRTFSHDLSAQAKNRKIMMLEEGFEPSSPRFICVLV